MIFWRSWPCWTTSDMAISIWSILFLQQLHGLAPATLDTQGSPPLRSRSSPLGLSSLSPDETKKINEAKRALEIAAWVAEQSLQCPSKFIGLNIVFPEDLGGHSIHGPSSMWVLREFRFLQAHVTLGVQLPTCVSSPDRNTSVRLEFSPTVPLSVLFCFWDGQT